MKIAGNVLLRIIATFVASALAIIGAGSLTGVQPVIAATVGGILAVAKVIERLSIAFLEDGKITKAEIDAAFAQVVTLKNVAEDKPKKG
jgi:hypothetical protein